MPGAGKEDSSECSGLTSHRGAGSEGWAPVFPRYTISRVPSRGGDPGGARGGLDGGGDDSAKQILGAPLVLGTKVGGLGGIIGTLASGLPVRRVILVFYWILRPFLGRGRGGRHQYQKRSSFGPDFFFTGRGNKRANGLPGLNKAEKTGRPSVARQRAESFFPGLSLF